MTALDRRQIGAGLAILAFLVMDLWCSSGCGNPYLTAYRTIATARATAATTEQALTDACHVKRVACLETHGPRTPAYDACWDSCRKALTAWTKYTRPAINTAIVASVGAVATAEAIKGKVDLVTIGKILTCAGARGAEQWIAQLPVSIRAMADAIVRGAAGYTCPKEVQ